MIVDEKINDQHSESLMYSPSLTVREASAILVSQHFHGPKETHVASF